MCEILVLKHNNKGLEFSDKAIGLAMAANDDGVGYAIFERNADKKSFRLVEVRHINQGKELLPKSAQLFVDFELVDKDHRIRLTDTSGIVTMLYLPKELWELKKEPVGEQIETITEWLANQGKQADFWQDVKPNDQISSCYSQTDETQSDLILQLPTETIKGTDAKKKTIKLLKEKQAALEKNQILIIHFRKATSGKTFENTQPIMTPNFMVIHNGIFLGLGDKDTSDTANFATNLEKIYAVANIKSEKQEYKFVKQMIEIADGWYSAFIYSFTTGKLYYFRDGASFYEAYNGLMYSTKEERFPMEMKEVDNFIV